MKAMKLLSATAVFAVVILAAVPTGCGSAIGGDKTTASKTSGDKGGSVDKTAYSISSASGDWTVADVKMDIIRAIVFGNGKFVAGGNVGKTAYSSGK